MAKLRESTGKTSGTKSQDDLGSSIRGIIDVERRLVLEQSGGANRATAFVVGAVLQALEVVEEIPEWAKFVGVGGQVEYSGIQVPANIQSDLGQAIEAGIRLLAKEGVHAEYEISGPRHTIKLSFSDEAANANLWVSKHDTRIEQQHGRRVPEKYAEAIAAIRRSIDTTGSGRSATDYAKSRDSLKSLDEAMRLEIARVLEPMLNRQASAMPQTTYEEKKQIAQFVNDELRIFGLAIRCPKSGEPSALRASQGKNPAVGRFQIESTDSAGIRHYRVVSSQLPKMELMLADLIRAEYGARSQRSR